MIIYNVTINIDNAVHDEWLKWMTSEHIPQVLATGKFISATLSKVLVEDDNESKTYSTQYRCSSRELLNSYYNEHAEPLRREALKRFSDKLLSFRTELEIIDDYQVQIDS